MMSLLRQRNFSLLWFGGLISLIGDWMIRIALPIYIYKLTNSTLATGLMFMIGVIPQILFGSIAGVFVDRWDRKKTMVVTNLLLGINLLPILLIRSAEDLWIIYIVLFISSSIGQFFALAENALLPTLVHKDQLLSANALNSLNNSLARLIGPTIAGFVVALLDLRAIALLDAFSFLIAAGMIMAIKIDRQPVVRETRRVGGMFISSLQKVVREWYAGLVLVKRSPTVTSLFIVTAIMSFGEGFFPVLFVAFVTSVLQGSEIYYGWLMSAQAVGGVIGGLLMSNVGRRVSSVQLVGWSSAIFGGLTLLIFYAPVLMPTIALSAVMGLMVAVGIPAISCRTALNTLLQQSIADEYRGRIYGAYNAMSSIIALISMGLAGSLGEYFGIVTILSIESYAYILAGVVALFLLRKNDAKLTVSPSS